MTTLDCNIQNWETAIHLMWAYPPKAGLGLYTENADPSADLDISPNNRSTVGLVASNTLPQSGLYIRQFYAVIPKFFE